MVFRMAPKPLLIVSDGVAAPTGLARITRDLTSRIHTHLSDVYRVATAGHASCGSSRFPWMQYSLEGMKDWVLPSLPEICEDHFRGENGIIWFIWDLGRLGWFSQSESFPEPLDPYPGLHNWLRNLRAEKWVYAPIDAECPGGRLSFPLAKVTVGFNRIFTYGTWSASLIVNSLGMVEAAKRNLTYAPHGIDTEIFCEMPRMAARKMFFNRTGAVPLRKGNIEPIEPIGKDELLIGIVATNQPRKDWALGIEAVAKIAEKRPVRLWIHTDKLERAGSWSIPTLLVDFRLLDKVAVSMGYLSDEVMAEAYSACDVTLGIGSGEGFGYPIFESMFCGTPCVHGNYGGAPEWMGGDTLLVEPAAYRYESVYGFKRPVFRAEDWVAKIEEVSDKRTNYPSELDWNYLWPKWWEPLLRQAAQ